MEHLGTSWNAWAVCWQIKAKHFEVGTTDLTKLSKSSLYWVTPRKKNDSPTYIVFQLWCFQRMLLARLCLYLVDQDFETSIVHVRLHRFHLANEAGFLWISILNSRPHLYLRNTSSSTPLEQLKRLKNKHRSCLVDRWPNTFICSNVNSFASLLHLTSSPPDLRSLVQNLAMQTAERSTDRR